MSRGKARLTLAEIDRATEAHVIKAGLRDGSLRMVIDYARARIEILPASGEVLAADDVTKTTNPWDEVLKKDVSH